MNALVTGGAGFIGSHLVDSLLDLEHRVTVIDNLSLSNAKNLEHNINNSNLSFFQKDICEDLSDILQRENIDTVFHLAALPRVQFSIKNPSETHRANINGTFNLLLLSKESNIKRFIYSSSSSIYGDQKSFPILETLKPNPMSPYALQKLVGEHYSKLFNELYGMETISLRYFNVFGPRQNPEGSYASLISKFSNLIGNNIRPTINGDGEQTRDFTYVLDVVEANILAANTKNKNCFGEAFNIGAGKNLSVNEVTDNIITLSGNDIKPIHGPSVVEPKNTLADINKAKEYLGWIPKTEFEDGLRETYAYFSGLEKTL